MRFMSAASGDQIEDNSCTVNLLSFISFGEQDNQCDF